MTALHVLIETVIIVGLAVLTLWLLRELVRFCDREIRRHYDRALADHPVRQQDVAYVDDLAARWGKQIKP